MIFGLMANPLRDPGYETLRQTVDVLEARGVRCVTAQEGLWGAPELEGRLEKGTWDACDLVISVGGDGSFLSAVRAVYPRQIPLIGVNKGSLGFMNEINPRHLERDLDRLIRGDYHVVTRMMLEVEVLDSEGRVRMTAPGLNDAVLSRAGYARIVPIHLYLDGKFVEVVPADGMIVAAPVGSTGYSLAAGGAIVDPGLEVLQITPISPHTLHNRSYILHPATEVMLTVGEDYPHEPLLSVDGRSDIHIERGDRILVRRAARPMMMIRLERGTFFRDLPAKINARGGYRT